MKRKLLILSALFGFSVLGIHKPAAATSECSYQTCSSTWSYCTCPAGTARAGEVIMASCNTWYPDCNYW